MIDQSAACGCRRISTDDVTFTQVVYCPDHASGCPGPWRPSVVTGQDYPDEGDYADIDRDGPRCEGCGVDLDNDACLCGPAGPRLNGVWTGENGREPCDMEYSDE